jgi:hypothetical protein
VCACVRAHTPVGMWSDALRVAKEYVPTLLPKLEQEFEVQQLKSGAK